MKNIKPIIGKETLTILLPKYIVEELGIEYQDTLNFEVKNRQLVICKNHESETFSDRGVGQ